MIATYFFLTNVCHSARNGRAYRRRKSKTGVGRSTQYSSDIVNPVRRDVWNWVSLDILLLVASGAYAMRIPNVPRTSGGSDVPVDFACVRSHPAVGRRTMGNARSVKIPRSKMARTCRLVRRRVDVFVGPLSQGEPHMLVGATLRRVLTAQEQGPLAPDYA